MAKQSIFDEEARKYFEEGVDILADAVKVILDKKICPPMSQEQDGSQAL
jgi:hypothetical protein